ncbi:hypothetical protein GCM10023074_31760 [Microbispora amethystogenes]
MAAASIAVRTKPVSRETIVPAAMIALARSILLMDVLRVTTAALARPPHSGWAGPGVRLR